MTTTDLETVEHLWPSLSPLLFVPRTETEYDRLVHNLDALIDIVGGDEAHPLASLMDVLGVLVQEYENQHVPEITA